MTATSLLVSRISWKKLFFYDNCDPISSADVFAVLKCEEANHELCEFDLDPKLRLSLE